MRRVLFGAGLYQASLLTRSFLCLLTASCISYLPTLKIESMYSSETQSTSDVYGVTTQDTALFGVTDVTTGSFA
jgi:hypothetical protein